MPPSSCVFGVQDFTLLCFTNIYSIHLVIPCILKKQFLQCTEHSTCDVSVPRPSTDATFNSSAAQLSTFLLKRLYNRNFVTKQIRRASDIPRRLTLQTEDVKKTLTYAIIWTTFNSSLPHISSIIKTHYNLLLSSNCRKSVFQHLPVVAFRRSPNLRDLLKLVLQLCPTPNFIPFPSVVAKNCAACDVNSAVFFPSSMKKNMPLFRTATGNRAYVTNIQTCFLSDWNITSWSEIGRR